MQMKWGKGGGVKKKIWAKLKRNNTSAHVPRSSGVTRALATRADPEFIATLRSNQKNVAYSHRRNKSVAHPKEEQKIVALDGPALLAPARTLPRRPVYGGEIVSSLHVSCAGGTHVRAHGALLCSRLFPLNIKF